MREIELPHLLALGENPDFNFVVGSILEKHPGSGHLDYSAPDELLCQQPGTLSRLNQMPINSKADRMAVANALIRQRMFLLRSDVNECGGVLALDVQTRIPPTALRFGGHLVLRLRPPNVGERRPHYDGLQDLSGFLGQLPQLIEIAGATSIRVRGGAHLSVACAIGAAIPTTLIGTVEVVDAQGERWVLKGQAPTPDREPFTKVVTPSVYHYERGPVLIYIDLLPQRSDAAYDAILSSHEGSFAGAIHIRHRREKLLNAGDAAVIVGELAGAIRSAANNHQTTEAHLLLRCPYPIALLLGRTLNTLTVHLYEWETSPERGSVAPNPIYIPSVVLQSGVGGSPIRVVTAPSVRNSSSWEI